MRSIALKYGFMMAAGFVLYFLVMRAFGLSDNYYFRIFNGLIHIVFITMAIKKYKDYFPQEFNYLSGVTAGVLTSLVGVVPFAIFMLVFLSITPDFMAALQREAASLGSYLTPYTAALIVLIEGLAVSVLASYIIMRIVDSYR